MRRSGCREGFADHLSFERAPCLDGLTPHPGPGPLHKPGSEGDQCLTLPAPALTAEPSFTHGRPCCAAQPPAVDSPNLQPLTTVVVLGRRAFPHGRQTAPAPHAWARRSTLIQEAAVVPIRRQGGCKGGAAVLAQAPSPTPPPPGTGVAAGTPAAAPGQAPQAHRVPRGSAGKVCV